MPGIPFTSPFVDWPDYSIEHRCGVTLIHYPWHLANYTLLGCLDTCWRFSSGWNWVYLGWVVLGLAIAWLSFSLISTLDFWWCWPQIQVHCCGTLDADFLVSFCSPDFHSPFRPSYWRWSRLVGDSFDWLLFHSRWWFHCIPGSGPIIQHSIYSWFHGTIPCSIHYQSIPDIHSIVDPWAFPSLMFSGYHSCVEPSVPFYRPSSDP